MHVSSLGLARHAGRRDNVSTASLLASSPMTRPQKITLAEMRDMGVRGLLIYCSDYKCSHLITMSGDRWPDEMRLSDLAPRFICLACGKRGADVRPDFSWGWRQCR